MDLHRWNTQRGRTQVDPGTIADRTLKLFAMRIEKIIRRPTLQDEWDTLLWAVRKAVEANRADTVFLAPDSSELMRTLARRRMAVGRSECDADAITQSMDKEEALETIWKAMLRELTDGKVKLDNDGAASKKAIKELLRLRDLESSQATSDVESRAEATGGVAARAEAGPEAEDAASVDDFDEDIGIGATHCACKTCGKIWLLPGPHLRQVRYRAEVPEASADSIDGPTGRPCPRR